MVDKMKYQLTKLEYELLLFYKSKEYKYISKDSDGVSFFKEEPEYRGAYYPKENVEGCFDYCGDLIDKYCFKFLLEIKDYVRMDKVISITEILQNCEIIEE